MRCPSCNSENPETTKFCGSCGAPLEAVCSNCGAENPPQFKFCGECGTPLRKLRRSPEPARPRGSPLAQNILRDESGAGTEPADGERKTVTALFADIKGSTELMRDLDPEEARAIVDPALKLMIDAAHRYDGYVVQSTGDGIFALFGAPVAHEDHPQRALRAALAMRDALRRSGEELKKQGRSGVEVRIGINTGEVVLRMIHTGGHTEYTPVGHVANLAARMQGVAPAGGIVISEDTRRLVEGYFELRGLGKTEVKGVSEALSIYEVVGIGALRGHFELAERRGLTKFVGREREVAEMKRALELARSGHGQIVAAVGEAGAGKSRLVYEFKAMLPGDCKVLEAYSVSHGKASAYLPVLELLSGYFGIEGMDDAERRREKAFAKIAALDPALEETLNYLFALLGVQATPDPLAEMDPQIKRRRMLDAIKRIILRESLNQPTIVIFEDLHWIDGETQALLDLLADGIANARMLLVVNYRPEYRHQWTNKTYYVQLRLDALGRESAGEMLSTLLGDSVELDPLKHMVIERTEGNPFFIEEMVQALFDEGALVRNGAVKVARAFSQLRLPPTVQGILASRIDRLPVQQKDLLQTLAVMGRESPLALIRQVTSTADAQLERMLGGLQAGELVYEQPAAAGVEYTFKHALTQEVAYSSILIERRKVLHEHTAVAMESLYADRLDDFLNELAHHYQRSVNGPKAIQYLQLAGLQAAARSSHEEATGLFASALELLKVLPETPERRLQELALQLGLGSALTSLKGFTAPEVGRAFDRASELCRQIGSTPQLSPVLVGLEGFYGIRAEFRRACELAQELLSIAEGGQDAILLVWAHFLLGHALSGMGKFTEMRNHLECAISFYDPARSQSYRAVYPVYDPGVASLCWAALSLCFLGYPDQALKRSQQGLTLARELSHPFSLALALTVSAGGPRFMRREGEASLGLCDEALRLSTEHGFQQWSAATMCARACSLIELNRVEEGIGQLQQGIIALRASGAEFLLALFLAALGNGCRRAGRVAEGLTAVAEGIAISERNGEHWYDAELYRLRGELLLMQDANARSNVEDEARGCFLRALEIARDQQAKWWELRATISLARLLASQGKRDEARMMLAEIYNWFTEGFDTADLKDVKALLDELAG